MEIRIKVSELKNKPIKQEKKINKKKQQNNNPTIWILSNSHFKTFKIQPFAYIKV